MLKSYSENFTQGVFQLIWFQLSFGTRENHGATIRSNTTTRFAVWIVFCFIVFGL